MNRALKIVSSIRPKRNTRRVFTCEGFTWSRCPSACLFVCMPPVKFC